MRVKVILNPCADLGHGLQNKVIIEAEGEKWGGLDLVVSDHKGHAFDLAREAVMDGYDVIVAAGGDGTVHEIVNGMWQKGSSHAKLGVIPIGTGNDFAFALNIPDDVPLAVEKIFQNKVLTVDLAKIVDDRDEQRLFANNLGVGFDANVVIRVESISMVRGFLKYFWGVLKTLVLDFRPFGIEMRFDDEHLVDDILFIAFGVGSRHGGGFMLTPDASNGDNKIDSCMVRTMKRLQALMFLNSAVQGTHITNPLVTMRQSQEIEISCKDPLPIHIDGEVFSAPKDDVHQFKVTSLPAAIEILV